MYDCIVVSEPLCSVCRSGNIVLRISCCLKIKDTESISEDVTNVCIRIVIIQEEGESGP